MKKIWTCLFCFVILSQSIAQQTNQSPDLRSSARANLAPFYHGVASGDPLDDRVIIWTRVTTTDSTKSVIWRVATDTSMSNLIDTGVVVTSAAVDYTVKIDVAGLQPNTFYYYEFEADGNYSIRGRTKTAPKGDVDSLRFGVVSCARYHDGYYNAYARLADRNDVCAILHLGDYYYENDGNNVRPTSPSKEILNLEDYRMRLSHYRLDEDLMRVHQQYPFICVWDDHETANNSWSGGADNHDASEGNWFNRKAEAIKAYFEWMPVRMPDPALDTLRIYRKFRYGDLVELHMLDTRLQGREEQSSSAAADPGRTILGANQFDWLCHNMDTSTAQWQLLGQQVMVAPLNVNPLPFGQQFANNDQWDGYQDERNRLYDSIFANNIQDVVVLTGDIHTSWGNDLPTATYDASTGSGSAGVEFVTTSVTTQSAPSALNGVGTFLVQQINDHMKFVDLSEKGYMIIDVNKTRVQSDWYYVDRIDQKSPNESIGASWQSLTGSRHLTMSPAASFPSSGQVGIPAPDDPRINGTVAVNKVEKAASVLLGAYPNPFDNQITLHYTLKKPQEVRIRIIDALGTVVAQKELGTMQAGIFQTSISSTDLAAGTYFVFLETENNKEHRIMVKVK